MIQVRLVNVSHVPFSQAPTPPLDHIKLSLFDTAWFRLPLIQRLLFFDGADCSFPPFPALLHSLKSSLSQTLSKFYPFAGKLTYLSASGDVEIDCSAAAVGAGVSFVEAEAIGDFSRLASDPDHDVESFLRLLPELDTLELPAPVFAVQVTEFRGSGVVVGFSTHHAVVDGRAIWQFMEAWAACCRADGGSPLVEQSAPSFDRAVIRHPRGDEIARDFLQKVAPALPRATSSMPIEGRHQLSRRTFTIDAQSIASLKQRAMQPDRTRPPSTFVVVSAHIWTAYVRSKSLNQDDDTYFCFLADCRSRLDPPVHRGYFGNCIKWCHVPARAGDLLAEDGFVRACSAIQNYIAESESLKEPLKGCERWVGEMNRLPFDRIVVVAASPQFRVYETDFGWGGPTRVEMVTMNLDGEVVMARARDGVGVQVSVASDPLQMEDFAAYFASGLGG